MKILAAIIIVLTMLNLPSESMAQSLTDGLIDDGSLTQNSLQLIALITVLSLAPGILIMITCYPFTITV